MNLKKDQLGLIPQPSSLQFGEGSFKIDGAKISCEDRWLADYVAKKIELQTGRTIALDSDGLIRLSLDESMDGNHESYSISVDKSAINVIGKTNAGLFYGVQTFIQLLSIDRGNTIPCLEIHDEPRFPYRGMMLDTCRHFWPVEQVKRSLDLMASHKLNRFHWHLTEDQGWRIQIDKYPKLIEVGSKRKSTTLLERPFDHDVKDGIPYEGHYTKDDVREIVAYAAERYITVIPEIEMPGHSQAAMAAYPWLGCTDEVLEVSNTWGVMSKGVVCPSEETFEFFENVLLEVMELFPSEYIHIGADEAPKDLWKESSFVQEMIKRENLKDEDEVQSYFIKRIEKFLNSHGRRLIGWDEILEGGLAPEATVMSWQGVDGGIAAAKQGHDVIMTPTTHLYLDYYQGPIEDEPLAIGTSTLYLETVYAYEPIPDALNADEAKHILGAQANVWTEYINNQDHLDYMVFPRLTALAELVWSKKEDKNYSSFLERLGIHYNRLDKEGVKYRRHD